MQENTDIKQLSIELLTDARNLPRHTLSIWRKDVSQLAKQLRVMENYLNNGNVTSNQVDSVRLRLSEIHFILSDCRYYQLCTIFVYLLAIVSFGSFIFLL